MALHYPNRRRSPTSPNKDLASWSCYHFRIDWIGAPGFLIQRFQTHCPPCKVKIDAEVPQEITTKNTTLCKPRSLVYRFHVEHGSIDLLEFTQSKTQPRQLQKLHVFRHSSGAKDTHLRRLKQVQKLLFLGQLFRNNRDARRRINN